MRFKAEEIGLIKQILKEMRDLKRRIIRMEEIKLSESEIRKGKYKTLSEVKKELGIR